MRKWIGPLGHPLDKVRPIEGADAGASVVRSVIYIVKKHSPVELEPARAAGARMQIPARRADIGVAERRLHLMERGTLFNSVRPVSMPQPMRRDRSIDTGPCRRSLYHPVHSAFRQAAALAAGEYRIIRAGVAAQGEQ
jgi:hypothetical protein